MENRIKGVVVVLATVLMLASLTVILCVTTNCTGAKNAAIVASTGTIAYQSFGDVYEIIQDNLSAFSPRDVARLREAGKTLTIVKAEVSALALSRGSALEMVADLPELIPLYEKARNAYIQANGIVMGQIDEFSVEDQLTLYAFRGTCIRLDTAILESQGAASENAQLVRDIVGFVLLVGKIVLPLVIV